jgi:hypothetical protein
MRVSKTSYSAPAITFENRFCGFDASTHYLKGLPATGHCVDDPSDGLQPLLLGKLGRANH